MSIVLGKHVGPVGYGMMSLTLPWKIQEETKAIDCLRTAVNNGATLWNASTHYGTPEYNSLHLMKAYFTKYPEDADRVILTLKGAFAFETGPTGDAASIHAAVDKSNAILAGTKKIDVFACARVDPKTPIETSMEALAELVKEGKIGGVGLSEVSAATIRRASRIVKVVSIENELSLFTPDALTSGVMEACKELDVKFIAYSPIGRGWLTGTLTTFDALPEDDYRRRNPRFSPQVFEQNLKLADAVKAFAERKGVTPAQVALGWVVKQGAIPIPGSINAQRITENCHPVELNDDEIRELQGLIDSMPVGGLRYGGEQEKLLQG